MTDSNNFKSVTIDFFTHKSLDELANKTGKSKSKIVTELIKEKLCNETSNNNRGLNAITKKT